MTPNVAAVYWENKTTDSAVVHRTYHTNMTVRAYDAWSGAYPAVRELLQNSIDYTGLVDAAGMRRAEVRVAVTSPTTTVLLRGDDPILEIEAFADELTLRQYHTPLLHPVVVEEGIGTREDRQARDAESCQVPGTRGDAHRAQANAERQRPPRGK